jgi:hypothetical protein
MASSQFFPKLIVSEKKSEIVESNDIIDVLKYCARDRCLVLDLDNTVIEPDVSHEELGSDQWFVGFINYASNLDLAKQGIDAISLVITIYHAVQHHLLLKLIQPEIVPVINLYLNLDNPVVFLTMRGSAIKAPTLRELKRLGIDLSTKWGKRELILDIGDGDTAHAPTFKNGVIFCGGKPKEQCLHAFLKFIDKKPDIIMIDDKVKYLESVIKMVNNYGGSAIGLRYGRLDEKVKQHNFEKAQRKLDELSPHLPPDAQEAMSILKLKM